MMEDKKSQSTTGLAVYGLGTAFWTTTSALVRCWCQDKRLPRSHQIGVIAESPGHCWRIDNSGAQMAADEINAKGGVDGGRLKS